MDFQPMNYIFKANGGRTAYTLLLLHGTGGNENDLIPLASNFEGQFNILSIRGNVSENGMPRFFRRLGMGIFDEKDLDFRTGEMIAFINSIADKEGFDINKLIALGYSNGANIAGAALVKHPDFLAGAILYRPMQPFKEIISNGTINEIPVFITSGSQDPTVNSEDTDAYINKLMELGFSVDFHNLHTGHNLVNDDVRLAAEWLDKNFK